jgi:hypothetical protein
MKNTAYSNAYHAVRRLSAAEQIMLIDQILNANSTHTLSSRVRSEASNSLDDTTSVAWSDKLVDAIETVRCEFHNTVFNTMSSEYNEHRQAQEALADAE